MLQDKKNLLNRRNFMQITGGTLLSAATLSLSNPGKVTAQNQTAGKPMARTVLGDISPEELGMTLVHTHLTVDWSEMYTPGIFGPIDDAKHDEIVSRLSTSLTDFQNKFLASYGNKGTIVECTPIRTGRFPQLWVDIAKKTPVHIIGMTGHFGVLHSHFSHSCAQLYLQPNGLEKLAQFYIKEIKEGMEDPYAPFGTRFTGIKAGILKACTCAYMTPLEQASHRGVALACIETGCPITTHTSNGGGMEQVDLFLSMGVPPHKIAIGHLGYKDDMVNDVAFDYITKIADRGCYVEFDRPHTPYTNEHYAQLVAHLKKQGFIDRILFGYDALPYTYKGRNKKVKTPADWTANEDSFDFPWVVRDIRPALSKAGITEDEVTTLFVKNPSRFLAF
ncbi:MAG: hypothetical protein M1426_05910 [Patescibacteria group bacterium]|nr:hypothetical protein [Patescibacteria group bacterium]